MSTALDLDIAALVGEMDAIPCDSTSHEQLHADEAASHYARATCTCGFNAVRAYCPTMVNRIANNYPIQCTACNDISPASQCITILGPIGGHQ